MDHSTFTITYGDCAENHAGMQKIGDIRDGGLTNGDIRNAAALFREAVGDDAVELINLSEFARVPDNPGVPGVGAPNLPDGVEIPEEVLVLVVRGGATLLLESEDRDSDDLFAEMAGIDHDKQAKMRGRVVNKIARWNVCFDDEGQEPDYEEGRGRVVAYSDAPLMDAIRRHLPDYFGETARDLKAELNYYYDIEKCGIGYHGDSERKIVIGVRAGAALPLHFSWWFQGRPFGQKAELTIRGGDLYAMSEKAAGSDWKRRVVATIRHAAGCPKYTDIK